MNSFTLLANNLGELLGAALWRASWQGGIALLIVWVISRTFTSFPARWKVWLWRLAYLKCLVAFFWYTPIDLPLLRPRVGSRSIAIERAQVSGPVAREVSANMAMRADSRVLLPPKEAEKTNPWTVYSTLAVFWTGGLLVLLIRLLYQHRSARLIRKNSRSIQNLTLRQQCEEMAERFGLRRVPDLLETGAVDRPGLMGMVRPAIVLPTASLAKCSDEHLRLIIAHEIAHQKRSDLLWASLYSCCEVLFFFHPLIWLARRECVMAQEIACDQLALELTATPTARYATMLLDIVATTGVMPRLSGFLNIIETKQTLQRRLLAMKRMNSTSRKTMTAFAIIFLILGAGGILPWRVVAQNKGEDELTRLRNENAKLKQELQEMKEAQESTLKQKSLESMEAKMQATQRRFEDLAQKLTEKQPLMIEQQAKLEAMQKRLAEMSEEMRQRGVFVQGQRNRFVTNVHERSRSPIKSAQRELLLAELKLAEEQRAFVQNKMDAGRGTPDELIGAEREVFAIRRELARLDSNASALKEVIQEEMKVVEKALQDAKKKIETGRVPVGSDIIYQKELLRLQRELLMSDELRSK